jgi:RNA polymerase sigma-70 factor (ECF subfamily)
VKNPAPGEYGADVEAQASAWMTAAKRGDHAAFDRLTHCLRTRACRVAQSLVGSREDALELAQEAFLKTYRARDTYREGEPFLPWFHRILRNTCFSFLRKEKRLRAASLSSRSAEDEPDWEIEGDGPAPAEGIAAEEAQSAFWRGFRRLSARDREILTLRHFQELPYRDIARALGIPEGTVMSRLFHARARLREALAGYFEEPPAAGERERGKEGHA